MILSTDLWYEVVFGVSNTKLPTIIAVYIDLFTGTFITCWLARKFTFSLVRRCARNTSPFASAGVVLVPCCLILVRADVYFGRLLYHLRVVVDPYLLSPFVKTIFINLIIT